MTTIRKAATSLTAAFRLSHCASSLIVLISYLSFGAGVTFIAAVLVSNSDLDLELAGSKTLDGVFSKSRTYGSFRNVVTAGLVRQSSESAERAQATCFQDLARDVRNYGRRGGR